MEERVVLVDDQDRELGSEAKLAAHAAGQLHRAFSVFVFDGEGNLLLQRRAAAKYHSASLWSNTCCGHPRPGEPMLDAARRRLREEMGIDCPLRHVFHFTYWADLGEGLCEHEFDHVFVGRFDGQPAPDPEEVAEWRWVNVEDARADLAADPGSYTVWFPIALEGLRSRGLPEQPECSGA
ncbi:MAG: isopentenyl-diphosphate Delta-isomerase [Gemmatimonadales bacterium]|nr:isopentenyl-diphosphate Delta-isomerase [Gemmatimonadales bacterium]NIN11357.1 isopentenyl-diphosphate Delta-isomerase [Gemmatimonadales bacterium]NIN49967.1 isopentenyl-diphosphate Delta-isomerase [Gemmatimonadales bacterium]NIP07431.1 isopentenyl-diphosphate Delta-isomerase [Gemmatimonadales bacterium]NIR00498.1 isopentenyl-diphosphate Delta-isomerase [Gemmatimonadales bacterium]